MKQPSRIIVSCAMLWSSHLCIAQSTTIGTHLISKLTNMEGVPINRKSIKSGQYIIHTNKNCFNCFKSLFDSLHSIAPKNNYNLILISSSTDLSIPYTLGRLSVIGVKTRRNYTFFSDLHASDSLTHLLQHIPSPWLLNVQNGSAYITFPFATTSTR
jgi:hypothetical protein